MIMHDKYEYYCYKDYLDDDNSAQNDINGNKG